MCVGVTENEAVPQDYIDKNLPIAENQIVLGGYRLYYIISYIFGSSVEESAHDDLASDITDIIMALAPMQI